MRTTIDSAGRVVIPKALRDQVGIRPGPVEVVVDGAGLHIEPPSGGERLVERNGRLVIAGSGVPVDDESVAMWRHADQR
jgi:AbrB family looped-hinge helix DNA binding protein